MGERSREGKGGEIGQVAEGEREDAGAGADADADAGEGSGGERGLD
jgi:hypothetical protein